LLLILRPNQVKISATQPAAAEPKELLIVPGANHVDLYGRLDKIPFDKITVFFEKDLK
jgi:fermentation-respiration switch protein FrsA (DUF1100 family)